jgi:Zn-dependent protease/predicted transcriptional regulator
MTANIHLGRILGIPIGLHVSWFLIFALVTWSLATGFFPGEYPQLGVAAYWALGALTSILFFASVLIHELAHSVVAQRHGIPVRNISLFIFGGVAQIGEEPKTAGAEFRIAIAGPVSSLLLAALFGVIYLIDQPIPYLAAPSLWLMRINFTLAIFNLIPGFPLDGGRVLRAAVWSLTRDYFRGTQVAAFAGQIIAFGFIGIGLLVVLTGNFFNGIWLVFIGWFLQNAAASSYAQSSLQHSLRGVRVAQVMSRECVQVPADMSIHDLVEERVLGAGQRCFFVAENGRLRGMLTLRDFSQVPRSDWTHVRTEEAMVPLERVAHVQPDTELMTALKIMDDAQVNQVPVMWGDQIQGVLSREQILRYVRTRAELGM